MKHEESRYFIIVAQTVFVSSYLYCIDSELMLSHEPSSAGCESRVKLYTSLFSEFVADTFLSLRHPGTMDLGLAPAENPVTNNPRAERNEGSPSSRTRRRPRSTRDEVNLLFSQPGASRGSRKADKKSSDADKAVAMLTQCQEQILTLDDAKPLVK